MADGATLTGDWEGVAERLKRLPKELDAAIRLATEQNARGLVGAIQKGITSGTLLDGTVLRELHPYTVARRLAEVGPTQRDRMLARLTQGKSARPLFYRGDLARSFTYRMDSRGWSAVVGVNRTAVSKDGQYLVNIAKVQFKGAVIRVTPKMRAYLHATGLHLKTETTHITIPPRDPVTPTYNAYKPTIVDRYRQALAGIWKK